MLELVNAENQARIKQQKAMAGKESIPLVAPFEYLPHPTAGVPATGSRGLQPAGGGGTTGGVTDDWKKGVDRQLMQLHGDVSALLYGLIAGFLFLIAAGGYAYMKIADLQTAAQVQQAKTDGKIDMLVERTPPLKK